MMYDNVISEYCMSIDISRHQKTNNKLYDWFFNKRNRKKLERIKEKICNLPISYGLLMDFATNYIATNYIINIEGIDVINNIEKNIISIFVYNDRVRFIISLLSNESALFSFSVINIETGFTIASSNFYDNFDYTGDDRKMIKGIEIFNSAFKLILKSYLEARYNLSNN